MIFLVFLQLLLYLFHQYEEHTRAEFKLYVNQVLKMDRDLLSDRDLFWINILLVWIFNLVGLYLAVYLDQKLGLFAGYLSLLNGISHLGMLIIRRDPNPGVWTS